MTSISQGQFGTPGAAIITCLRKYATFSGRAGRGEYWWFLGAAMLASLAVTGLDRVAFRNPAPRNAIEAAFSLLIFLPLIAAGFRRLHDSGRPGWLMLLAIAASVIGKLLLEGGILNVRYFTPPVQSPLATVATVLASALPILLILYWLTRPSEPGPNRYGLNPHEVSS